MTERTRTTSESRTFRLGLALAGTLFCACAPASAQVIEIAPDGAVAHYDGPAIVAADGAVTPLKPASAARSRAAPPAASLTLAARAASAFDLSPALIQAVAWQESRFHPRAVSPAGAVGEMQLMPATARALGVDPFDPEQNYRGGAAYLGALLRRYDGDLVRALAAYNAGPGAVDRYGGVPPYRETRAYVAAVLNRLGALSPTPSTEGPRP